MPDATQTRPRALVVFESMFGNTESVARTVAESLERAQYDVTLTEVNDPSTPSGRIDADLVVVGAPTHAFSLSRPSTRADAVRQGAPSAKQAIGLREWIGSAAPTRDHPVPLIAFDTRVQKVRRLPKAAGPRATWLARHRGFDVPVKPAAFLVSDTPGPLVEGELARAAAWVADVVDAVRPAAAGTGRNDLRR